MLKDDLDSIEQDDNQNCSDFDDNDQILEDLNGQRNLATPLDS